MNILFIMTHKKLIFFLDDHKCLSNYIELKMVNKYEHLDQLLSRTCFGLLPWFQQSNSPSTPSPKHQIPQ